MHAVGKTKEARAAYAKLVPLARYADRDLPVFQRLAPIVESWKADKSWAVPDPTPETDEATAHRVDLETLGPLVWSPFPAEPFALRDTQDKPWTLAEHKGQNVVVLFVLGNKCAHCMQQLQVFGKEIDALKALNTTLVAVSTDDPDACKALKNNADGIKFPMPLLADPKFDVFKPYQAFDDFEDQPLHGAFLIDAQGNVRFQRISADPFLDVDFMKTEAARINRLAK